MEKKFATAVMGGSIGTAVVATAYAVLAQLLAVTQYMTYMSIYAGVATCVLCCGVHYSFQVNRRCEIPLRPIAHTVIACILSAGPLIVCWLIIRMFGEQPDYNVGLLVMGLVAISALGTWYFQDR